jgi:hypothetical protein
LVTVTVNGPPVFVSVTFTSAQLVSKNSVRSNDPSRCVSSRKPQISVFVSEGWFGADDFRADFVV